MHVKSAHKFECDQCDYISTSETLLNMHMESAREFAKTLLKRHKRSAHEFACEQCDDYNKYKNTSQHACKECS